MKNRDFVVGMILSFACEGAATVKREPTAYSYNGVVLPKLPEWDRETYPYAVIEWVALGICAFKCAKTPFYATGAIYTEEYTIDGEIVYYEHPEVKCDSETIAFTSVFISPSNPADSWELANDLADAHGTFASGVALIPFVNGAGHGIYWTAHDITDTEGTVYLATSVPVPVYELKE